MTDNPVFALWSEQVSSAQVRHSSLFRGEQMCTSLRACLFMLALRVNRDVAVFIGIVLLAPVELSIMFSGKFHKMIQVSDLWLNRLLLLFDILVQFKIAVD